MIHVVQGHEKGIGLEVFLKSILLLPQQNLSRLKLYCYKDALNENLNNLRLPFQISCEHFLFCNKKVKTYFCEGEKLPQSTTVLNAALDEIKKGECLLTLPTSKDQLIIEGQSLAGYTEFFRYHFNDTNIAMLFKGPRDLSLLLTDHIPLKDVSEKLKCHFIKSKMNVVLEGLSFYFFQPKNVFFSGINPSCRRTRYLRC
jgi:4-hydroxythreonine-4-phosphate dehydrogenase